MRLVSMLGGGTATLAAAGLAPLVMGGSGGGSAETCVRRRLTPPGELGMYSGEEAHRGRLTGVTGLYSGDAVRCE